MNLFATSKRLEQLETENRELQTRLAQVYQRTPPPLTEEDQAQSNLQRKLIVAATSEEDPLWKTILSYADEHQRNETAHAIAPDLSNDKRQYNAGRCAGATDFASFLRDVRAQAIKELGRKLNRE